MQLVFTTLLVHPSWNLIIVTRPPSILPSLKLMCHFYLQHPLSHKCFEPLDVEHVLSLLESWAPASSFTNVKLLGKPLLFLALVTAKYSNL